MKLSGRMWITLCSVVALSAVTLGTAVAQDALTIVSWGGALTPRAKWKPITSPSPR